MVFTRFNEDAETSVVVFSPDNPETFCGDVAVNDVHEAMSDKDLSLVDPVSQCDDFCEEPGCLHNLVIAKINGLCVPASVDGIGGDCIAV